LQEYIFIFFLYLYLFSCYFVKHNAPTTTLRFFFILRKFLRTLGDSRRSTDCGRALKYFISNMYSNPNTTKSDARLSFSVSQSYVLFWSIMSFVLRLSRIIIKMMMMMMMMIIIIIIILRKKLHRTNCRKNISVYFSPTLKLIPWIVQPIQ